MKNIDLEEDRHINGSGYRGAIAHTHTHKHTRTVSGNIFIFVTFLLSPRWWRLLLRIHYIKHLLQEPGGYESIQALFLFTLTMGP